jgi:hypothetical protein
MENNLREDSFKGGERIQVVEEWAGGPKKGTKGYVSCSSGCFRFNGYWDLDEDARKRFGVLSKVKIIND